jgi:hypothetical protein
MGASRARAKDETPPLDRIAYMGEPTPTSRSPERSPARYAETVGFTYADKTAVLVRSYSRHCVLTSWEATISTSGRAFERSWAARRSCSWFVHACRKQIATASTSSTRSRWATDSRAASSRGTMTVPVCVIRSGTSNRRRRGTNGRGLRYERLYRSGRFARPISSTSRNPSVVTSAVRAPRRSVTALITTVLPWTNAPTSPGRSSERSSADSTPCWRCVGVVPTFARISEPSRRSTAARSVNVPPMSIASAIGPWSSPIRALYPGVGVDRSPGPCHAIWLPRPRRDPLRVDQVAVCSSPSSSTMATSGE